MPITKSALKALRQDRKRTVVNRPIKSRTQAAVIAARRNPTPETVRQAYSALDKAVKKHIFKKGKADRLKRRLAALLAKNRTPNASTKPASAKPNKPKPTAKKAAAKKKA